MESARVSQVLRAGRCVHIDDHFTTDIMQVAAPLVTASVAFVSSGGICRLVCVL